VTTLDIGGKKVDVSNGVTVVKLTSGSRDDVASRLAKTLPVVRAGDVPRPARPHAQQQQAQPQQTPEPPTDAASAEAEVAAAEAALADAKVALDHAEVAYRAAQDALLDARRTVDRDAIDALRHAEARLEVAQAGAAAARRALVQAREAANKTDADAKARRSEAERQAAEWRAQLDELQARRRDVDERLRAAGPAPEAAPVEEALAGLRRLRSVKPKPSAQAAELADRWVAARARLAALPGPPSPPEWLVAPALAALTEAREALAEADASVAPPTVDPARIEAVEAAHREVLEAEQRAMRKGNRQNKRRLDAAQEDERAALVAVGVNTYGEFLQRVVPDDGLGSGDERVKQARAALADAEAVWEELHGGQASTEYTAAREDAHAVRAEALALLGQEVADDQLEAALRAHVEAVVDTGWAEQALADALAASGAPAGDDLEAAAEAWLASLPQRREERAVIEAEGDALDTRAAELERLLADAPPDQAGGGDGDGSPTVADAFAELQAALDEADEAEREAEAAVAEAQRRVEARDQAEARAAGFETAMETARVALDEARDRFESCERALDAARTAHSEAADAIEAAAKVATAAADKTATSTATATADTTPSVEADVWLLARLASTAGAAAFVVDARALIGRRSLLLLEKAAAARPVVVLGDEGEVTVWAAALGDLATVRTV
jgi:chromosome segregation protein